ncbi:MAG: hypothetical protein RLZZ127_1669 [Planctomycetota bacterium]|jgi:hypothetical protein
MAQPSDGDTSRIRRLTRTQTAGGTAPLQGELAEYPLADLLEFLARSRRSGHLALERGEPAQTAALLVHEGRVVSARCPPASGDQVVVSLLGWRHGRFLFLAGAVPAAGDVTQALPALLLEAARWEDEIARALAGLPGPDAVLHRVHDARLAAVRVGRTAWHLLGHVDGEHTVMELVQGFRTPQPEVAAALRELWAGGLVSERPDTAFLRRVVVRRAVPAPGGDGPEDRLLAAADGHRSLADILLLTGLGVEEGIATAVLGIEASRLEVVAGHDAYRDHLDPVLPERRW